MAKRLDYNSVPQWKNGGDAFGMGMADVFNAITSAIGLDIAAITQRGKTKDTQALNNKIQSLVDKILQDIETKEYSSTPTTSAQSQAAISIDNLRRKYTQELYDIQKIAQQQERDLSQMESAQNTPNTFTATQQRRNTEYMKRDVENTAKQAQQVKTHWQRNMGHEVNRTINQANHGMRDALKGARNGVQRKTK